MHVFIVYAHPAEDSFNRYVLETFKSGLFEAGYTYEVSDLYKMDFKSEMNDDQYQREVCMDPAAPIPDDVKMEQEKIDRADRLVFIYPVWWSDCPAKMKGWFDRVFTHGYAYFYDSWETRHTKIEIDKAIVICSTGHPIEHLEETGIAQSMRTIMLNDRLLGVGVKQAYMEILGSMMPNDDSMREQNLRVVYKLAVNL